jgi:hypothetical protein
LKIPLQSRYIDSVKGGEVNRTKFMVGLWAGSMTFVANGQHVFVAGLLRDSVRSEVGRFNSGRFAARDARELANEALVGFIAFGWLGFAGFEVGGDLVEGHLLLPPIGLPGRYHLLKTTSPHGFRQFAQFALGLLLTAHTLIAGRIWAIAF